MTVDFCNGPFVYSMEMIYEKNITRFYVFECGEFISRFSSIRVKKKHLPRFFRGNTTAFYNFVVFVLDLGTVLCLYGAVYLFHYRFRTIILWVA